MNGQLVTPMMIIMLIRLGPKRAATTRIKGSVGSVRKTSAVLMRAPSITPPKYPASNPTIVPSNAKIDPAAKAIVSEVLAP